MVNLLLLFCFLIPTNTNILFVSKYCSPCREAKKLVSNDTKIIDVHENPILADQYKIIAVPTYIIIKNSHVILRLVGLTAIREYCNMYQQKATFTGVLYFTNNKVVHNQITSGILRRIKRFNANLKVCDPNGELAKKYNITKLPTFIFVENGKEVGRYTGIIPNSFERSKPKPCPNPCPGPCPKPR